MSKYRTAIRLLFIAVLALPLSAFAANYDVKALIDTDNSRGTGCPVVLPDGNTVTGIDAILTTSLTVTGNTGTVTAVTRQTCVGGVFGGPVPVDNGWSVGVSPTGDLLIESHLGPNVVTMNNVGTPRFVFTTTSGLLFDTLLQPTTAGGGDIIMPQAARDRAVSTRALRTIVLNGEGSDWAGDVPLASGTDNHPALRFISVNAYAGQSDLYFKFLVHTNPAAPTAHDDVYDLPTLGGTLSVSTLGVLTNDNPNGQSIAALLVDNPQHGTVALNANGGFVYTNDGAHVPQDLFHYLANGNLPSNVATVTITMPGTKYVFTSPDHVIFTAGVASFFTVTVTGKPTPALSEDGALPAGITFVDNGDGTGTLSGTPASGTVGTYPLVFHAEKNKPHQTDQLFTLSVVCGGITVNNPAVHTGTVGTPFSQTFTQSGGAPPIVWSKSGTLPTGLAFNAGTGVLSGTPSQGGTFPITVTATDANGCSGTGQTYALTIACNSITVTNPVVNSGTVNVPFSQTFTQVGGIGTTTFSLNSGTLPTGLTLASTGVLSGTPAQTGSFPITVKATDSNGCSAVGPTYTLTIGCQVITVTNPATNTGTVNIAFSQTFTASNTIPAVTFSLNSGTLPAGLTLSSAGVLSGTPTQTGSFPITVKATDANGCFGIGATYTLTIACQVITVTNPATNTGTVNTAFSQTFTAGNTVGTVAFTLNSGVLPAGLTLSSAGVLSGTPTQTGSFPITVKATDANGCFGIGATYTLTIGCQVVSVTNPATNSGTVNAAFSQTFTAGNTIGAVTFTLNSGTLPAGLSLSSGGVLSGTPTQIGSFPITVKATDANGCFGIGATYNLTINCQVITVTNPATTTGTAGTAFSQTFTQTGGFGASTFAIFSGTLPTGMTFHSATGILDGTPTQTGSFPLVIRATDSNGCTGNGSTYTLVIGCQTITVTNPATTTGTAGTAFSQTFTQSGGIGTTTFAIFSGTVPAGMTFHSATGVLDGTPTQTGPFSLVIRATDSNGCTGNGATYPLVIGCQTITVTNPATTTGTAGTPFSQTFTQSGAIGGATFSLNSGSLPAGLSLSSGGVLSGTPTQTGSFPITVKATDANGCFGIGATYTLTIGCQTITVTNPATTTGTIQVTFSQTFTQSGAIGGATFSLNSGSLPAGLSLSSGGVVSGTPTVTGTFPITVKVTDGNGCTGVSATYNLVINCQTITVTNPATTTGTVSAPFTQTFTQTGANGTATFTTASTLPAGLTLATNGTLSGTPTQAGTFPIVVTVTDSNGCTGTGATYTLIIGCQTITVTNPVTTSGPAGTPFSVTFTQTGGIGTTTFSETGTLPTGLTFHTATGVLDGTPTQGGTFPITVTATDANGCTGTGPTYSLDITCPTITVTNPGVSSGTVDAAFSQTFTQSGGNGTITWSKSGAIPAGMTFHTTTGVLDGTPSVPGSFPITVTATDSNGCQGSGSLYTLVIACQTITVTNPGVTTGTVDAAFSQTFTQSGVGTHTPATFSLNSGSLPSGLSLSSAGVLSGTPGQPGSFPITVKVTDANGCTGVSATYTLVIACQTITVTKPVVTTGTVDAAFSQTFTQSGVGTHTPATFTLNSGSLPSGLSLSTAGVLSGTPSQPGSFPITVKVTDVNSCFGVSTTYTLVISCQTITVTNPATTTGTVNVAFSQTFTQSGVGTHTPATFTTASTLPTGFTLSTAGVLSGTTQQHNTFPIVVTVTDANGCTGTSATYNLVINCQTITVTNPATTTGTVSTPFTQTFAETGANGTATFTTASTLPAGLTLATDGTLSGTPTQAGTFPIVVTVTDSNGCTGTGATYTLIIGCQTITVTNPVTTSGPAGTPFSVTFTQTGGIGTTTFSETGTLPTGLTFHTATGVLDGTPTQGGTFPITVTATDANGCTGTGPTYSLDITCPVITVTNPGVSTGTVDAAFSQTFTQSGGNGTITWSKSGAIPAGMTFHTTTGVLDGTPSVPGSFPITVTATDSNGCQGSGSLYTLVIACQTITVTNPGVTTGTVDAAFSQTFTQSGVGTHTPATFSLNSGSLPSGLSLSSAGVLSGTPGQPGSFPITVKVTDANNCTGVSATYTLVIACQTITVTKPVVTTGTVDAAFSQTFTQSGVGTHTPATFTLNSGSLPPGLSLSTAGVLSGTPSQPGSFPITVKVTDVNSCFGVSTTYTLVISCQTITVTNPATTTGTVNVAFSQTFTQSGVGTHTPATFTTASTLPTGFTLSTAGVLSGTTQQHNTFPIVVTVTDANGCTGTSATYNLVINCQTITVTNPGVTTGTVGTPFSQSFSQSGGIGATTFSTASTLPLGLSLSSAGLLAGTPTQPGSFPIVVTATDSNGCTGTGATYTLVIACNVVTVTNPGVTTGTVDAAFSQTFTQSGGNGTITWSKTGAIPAGMTFHTTTGVLDGTPSVPGSFPITVTATDSNGCQGTGSTYTLVIACQTITVITPGVISGTVDAAFSQTFTQSGVGTHTPATFSLNSGSLAGTGLSLSSAGVLSGTPTAPGSIVITVKVTDANGCTGISATYTLVIACQTITVTNPVTTTGVFNTIFTQTFTQSGVGTHTPAVFSINSGTLPTGLSLSSAGVLSGTPTQTGTFPITVKVTDANGCTGIGATYNLAINPNLGADAYSNLVDNTQAFVTGGSTGTPGTPAVQLTGSVLANDLPAAGVSVTAGTFATTQGGSVTIQTDGTFLYTPSVHAAAIASDTFTYTGTSNTGGTATPTSATATVTLNLANRVWYVKDNGGAGNGQSQTPFNTLAAVQAAATANDIIFIYTGNTATTPLSGSLSLQNGAKLWGEAFGLNVNSNALVTAGATKPRIQSTAGSTPAVKVDTSAATAGSRTLVEIRGMDLEATGATSQAINVTSNSGNTTSITIDSDNIRGATSQGINLNQGSTSTFDATVSNTTITSAGNGIQGRTNTAGTMTITTSSNTISVSAGNGVDIATSAGASALNLALNTNTVTASGSGIVVNGAAAGTTTITSFLSNNINGNTAGGGISVTSATFDATPTGAFQTVSGGSTAVGSVGNGVGTAGVVLTNVAGDLSFTDLDIVSSGGAALFASGTTPYTGSAGFQIAISNSGAGTLDATGGPAADLNTVTANLPWGTIKSLNSSSTGVSLVTVPGTFTTTGATSSISNATNTDFNISGSNATVTYDGTITDASGRAVAIASTTGGTKTFSGAITNNGGTGISLTSNTGATINFSGNLTLSTGSSTAFNATGGGTVTASNTASTIVTTTGTGVNINSTTIGGAGVKFLSVTSNGAANGINLNTTGAGTFTVIGDGGGANNGSGGTIQNTTAEGIVTNSTGTLSFGYLNLTNSGTKGISVTGSTGVTINHCNLTDNAGGATDDGISLINNTGTITLSNDVVDSAPHIQANIDNFNTNLTSISATNSTFKCTAGNACQPAGSVGGNAFLVQIRGTSVLTSANVQSCTFTGARGTGIQVSATDTASIGSASAGVITAPAANHSFVIQSCTIASNNAGIDMDQTQHSNHAFELISNTLSFHKSSSINAFAGAGVGFSGSITGYINGNFIGIQGTKDSGSTSNGAGVRMVVQGDSTQGFFTVDSNTIREVPNSDVIIAFSQNGGTPNTGSTLPLRRFKITNNTLPQPSGTNQSLGCGAGVPCGAADGVIWIYADENNTNCALITGNNVYDATTMNGSWDILLSARTGPPAGAAITIQTGANGGNSAAATSFINSNNTLNGTNKIFDEAGNATTVISCGGFPP